MLPSRGSPWQLVSSMLQAQQAAWRIDIWFACRNALLTAMAMLHRKLVRPWLVWPWRLLLAFDPDTPHDLRIQCLSTFIATPACCLDPHFSRKLQARRCVELNSSTTISKCPISKEETCLYVSLSPMLLRMSKGGINAENNHSLVQ
eukprot:3712381-Amphidinium_carterae.4